MTCDPNRRRFPSAAAVAIAALAADTIALMDALAIDKAFVGDRSKARREVTASSSSLQGG